ncbi:hypothetical protein AN644_03475 [Candidatus Epulonipiscium fishelsonii]|nr:hypothetical protein AN644_03475 [Epulopiscium sp. SCG-C06WGA-EpuloA1]
MEKFNHKEVSFKLSLPEKSVELKAVSFKENYPSIFPENVSGQLKANDYSITEKMGPESKSSIGKLVPPFVSKLLEGSPSETKEVPQFRGSSYVEIRKETKGNSSLEAHHMPADSTNELARNDGPAIAMDKCDHRETASCGNSKEAREYRAEQKALISEGKFEEAFEMDVKDIQSKFGDKYDYAINEARQYLNTLKEEQKI